MTYKQDRTMEVLQAYLWLKTRIVLDEQRNKLFKVLDKYSKKLDRIAEIKIRNFDMSQYAMFRDLTENHYDKEQRMLGRLFPIGSPKVDVYDSRNEGRCPQSY